MFEQLMDMSIKYQIFDVLCCHKAKPVVLSRRPSVITMFKVKRFSEVVANKMLRNNDPQTF